jgi:hypothetical protein
LARKLNERERDEIVFDYDHGWSRKDIAFAHQVSEKQVRTVIYRLPDYRVRQLDHRAAQRLRREKVRLLSTEYNIMHKVPKKRALTLARETSRNSLRAKRDKEYEEKHFWNEYPFPEAHSAKSAKRSEVGSEDYHEALQIQRFNDQGLNRLAF